MSPRPEAQENPTLAVLEQTPIIIEKILFAATREQMHWKPAADRWSIGEVLSHLVEVEKVFRNRARQMVDHNDPVIEPYDQNAAYAAGHYSNKDAVEQLRLFCHERDLSVTWLRYQPPALTTRTARHKEIGPITLGQLFHEWAFHDLGHIRQIAELYRARAFYPKMGGFQRYYTVKP
jgi:hypothetical protein